MKWFFNVKKIRTESLKHQIALRDYRIALLKEEINRLETSLIDLAQCLAKQKELRDEDFAVSFRLGEKLVKRKDLLRKASVLIEGFMKVQPDVKNNLLYHEVCKQAEKFLKEVDCE